MGHGVRLSASRAVRANGGRTTGEELQGPLASRFGLDNPDIPVAASVETLSTEITSDGLTERDDQAIAKRSDPCLTKNPGDTQ
jgi:hypothetical protein